MHRCVGRPYLARREQRLLEVQSSGLGVSAIQRSSASEVDDDGGGGGGGGGRGMSGTYAARDCDGARKRNVSSGADGSRCASMS